MDGGLLEEISDVRERRGERERELRCLRVSEILSLDLFFRRFARGFSSAFLTCLRPVDA